tara:strand:+ start:997 stop:1266 length:270 start_codon:yes stop_codon:yes gene_type:complete
MPNQDRSAYNRQSPNRSTDKVRKIIETKIFGDVYIHIIRHYQYTANTYNACYEIQEITDLNSSSSIHFSREDTKAAFEAICNFHAEYSC